MRPPVLNPLFAVLTSLPGVGPKLEKLFRRLLGREDTPAHRRSAVPSADRRDRPPGASEAARRRAGHGRDRRGQGRPASPAAAQPRRARPISIYASDDTGDIVLTFFNARRDYLEKLLPVGEERYVSGTVALYDGMLQMVHPDRVVAEADLGKLPLIEPVYPLTEGLTLEPGPQGRRRRIDERARSAGVAGPSWLARERFAAFADALRSVHRPAEPADILPEGPAWSRLAYDELLAGQLALALVRAHLRRPAGRGNCRRRRSARRS